MMPPGKAAAGRLQDWARGRVAGAPGRLRSGATVALRVVRQSVEDRVGGLAAEVAFFGGLSLFPGLLILAATLGSLEGLIGGDLARQAEELVLSFLDRVLTEQAAGAVAAVRELFARPRGGLLTVASLLALGGLSRGFMAVIRALDLAYDLEERRSLVHQRLTALGLALSAVVVTVVVLAAVVLGPLLGAGLRLADWLGLGREFAATWGWLRWPFAFAVLVAWGATLHHVGPYRRTPWRAGLPGAALAGVLCLAVSACFGAYLRLAAAANQVLGALGGGLILLVWLYLLALAVLVGGELNAVLLARPTGRGPDPAGSSPPPRGS
jgi:membrane protein